MSGTQPQVPITSHSRYRISFVATILVELDNEQKSHKMVTKKEQKCDDHC